MKRDNKNGRDERGRFAKGTSGNPKGRPPSSRQIQHWLQKRPDVQRRADEKRKALGLDPPKRRRRNCQLPWKQTGPYELASLVVQRRFYPDGSPKSLQNRVSERANGKF